MTDRIKKSLLITLDFPPQNTGGVSAYYYNVCKNLPADQIVALAPQAPNAENFDKQQRFTIIRKNLLKQYPETWPNKLFGLIKIIATIRWLSIIKHFGQTIKNHKIELLQIGQVLPLGTLALAYKKVPYIIYAHGLDILLPQHYLRKKTLLKNIIKNAKGLVANSNFTKDELLKLGADPKKIVVAYPCPNIKPTPASQTEIDKIVEREKLKNKKIILTVGRLVKRKGHDMVIKALPQIIKQVPEAIYLIVGDGPMRSELQKLAYQNNLGERLKFLGKVSDQELSVYYQICDVFIMPSRQLDNGDVEGFGTVFLEANLFGKPVIGGRSGGIPEAVVNGQTGLLVDPLDINDIISATTKLLLNESYAAKLGTQGLERVENEFDWFSQTQKIKELLK